MCDRVTVRHLIAYKTWPGCMTKKILNLYIKLSLLEFLLKRKAACIMVTGLVVEQRLKFTFQTTPWPSYGAELAIRLTSKALNRLVREGKFVSTKSSKLNKETGQPSLRLSRHKKGRIQKLTSD